MNAMPERPMAEGTLLWEPRTDFVARTQMKQFMDWVARRRGVPVADYDALWRWSVTGVDAFWAAIWDYFDIESSTPYERVFNDRPIPEARWFEGSEVNYTEHLLRHESVRPQAIALRYASEVRPMTDITWAQLGRSVRTLASRLRELGVRPGDRVVGYLPNSPEAVIAMMASTAIGAIWSATAPEFGAHAVIDRFSQLAPKVCFVVDGYRFGGRDFVRQTELSTFVAALPSIETVIALRSLHRDAPAPKLPSTVRLLDWEEVLSGSDVARESFSYTRVGCDHPLWVLFTSGTTGLPKPIVHSHVGMLVEHFKLVSLHLNLKPGKTLFFHSTTSWMIWNVVVAGLLVGATAVLFDGNPLHPDPAFFWQLVERAAVTHCGANPALIPLMEQRRLRPAERFDLQRLEMVTFSGSPCTPEAFAWIYRHVSASVHVSSQSGGTEICSGFVGASPTLPVYAGEIQARMLGMDVDAWDESGQPVRDQVGELVVKSACPSMPIGFWNDADGARYRVAYLTRFPGVWHHGEFLKINARGGCFIYGRSDSTLKRHGVRIGTAEIYRALERVDAVVDSLVVSYERPGESTVMTLFVKCGPGVTLTEELRSQLCDRLRECSPRHVPDHIVQVDDIPYTLSGKKMEVPVKQLLLGVPLDKAASRDAMMNPDALRSFVEFANRHLH